MRHALYVIQLDRFDRGKGNYWSHSLYQLQQNFQLHQPINNYNLFDNLINPMTPTLSISYYHIIWFNVIFNSRQMFRQASKKQTSKHHDRSLDDFVKNLKRYNMKSQRYDRLMSPDPFAPYRNNTAHTLQRSRTLSGKQSRKTNKTTRQKVERMLSGSVSREKNRSSASKMASKTNSSKLITNPADLISSFSKRIRQTEHYLTGKSKMGLLLCRKFMEMLNQIVENMVLNLQQNLEELEKSISERVQKEIGERAEKRVNALQRKLGKLERQTSKLLQKQNYNSNLIYHLRLNKIDVDRQFGKCVFKSDEFGGLGYGARQIQKQDESELNHMSNSQLIVVRKMQEEEDNNDMDQFGNRQQWQWSPGKRNRRNQS